MGVDSTVASARGCATRWREPGQAPGLPLDYMRTLKAGTRIPLDTDVFINILTAV